MATIESAKVALQYGQSFLSADRSGVTVVTSVQAEDHSTSITHHNQQQHQHYTQVPIHKEPIILNHVLSSANLTVSSAVNPVISTVTKQHIPDHAQQQQIHLQARQMQPQQQQPVKMWLLLEWENPNGEPKSYTVIDSNDLILQTQSGASREVLHHGKTIYLRRGSRVQQATIVLISADKKLIDSEVRQRTTASEYYLQTNNPQEQNNAAINQELQAKRRCVESTVTEPEDIEPVSPEFEPMPVQSQTATANWVHNCKNERIVSPSPSVVNKQVVKPASLVNRPPPMTFDQQTQTDTRFFPQHDATRSNNGQQQELSKILSLLETILTEQKSMRMETEYSRKLTYNLIEQQNTFSESLKQMAAKVDAFHKYEITEVMKNPGDNVSSYVVLGTGGDESRDRAPSVAESILQKPTISNDNTHLTSDTASVQDESNMSFGHSKFAIHEESSINSVTSTPKNLNFANKLTSALGLSNNGSIQPPHPKPPAINEMLQEWIDDEDDTEMTIIGPNNTKVRNQVLRAINWNNYKAATRKLLMTLFSREMLASHTLTGRPSPAFMGDRAKPLKDKLDQKIIADIISLVTKTCNVSEPMVRTAITTKCADENKMSRMKLNKSAGGGGTPNKRDSDSISGDAKVEGSDSRDDLTDSPYPRRIKRENKENVN